MDSHESQSACLIEKPHTVFCDSLVATRRRRREIRILRKLTCPSTAKGLNFVHQGVPTKRAGLRPVYGGNSLHFLNNGLEEEEARFGDVSQRILSSRTDADALTRSRSFPLEGWQTSEYTLQISRIGKSSDVELRSRTTGVDRQCQIRTANSLGPLEGLSDYLHQSRMNTDFSKQKVDISTPDDGAPLTEGVESCSSVAPLPHEDRGVDANQPDIVKSISPDAVTDGLYLAGKAALLQSVEVNLSSSCGQGALEVQDKPKMNCPPSGKVLICGRRRGMEDTAVIVPSFVQNFNSATPSVNPDGSSCDLHFYGVYDGHGGSQASSYCAERLHHALAEEIASCSMTEENSGTKGWQSAMVSCFAKVDKEVGGVCPYGACDDVDSSATCCSGTIAPENVGTTAVVAVVSSSKIVLGNCGDSRAVLSRGGKAIPLSQDHKPERADETSRIEAAGGRVIAWKGYRVGALLALSRAIGDRYLKRYVISLPDVVCLERSKEDECLILASDGLWDVIDNDTACDVARRCLVSARGRERRTTSRGEDLACATAAATLVKLACGKGSQDNITVLVVDLRY